MKTTLELPDSLLSTAKEFAAARKMTLKEVVETGLRMVLNSGDIEPKPFRLRRCAFKGKGLAADFTWEQIRDKVYEGRGA